jgi:hypothetical protein
LFGACGLFADAKSSSAALKNSRALKKKYIACTALAFGVFGPFGVFGVFGIFGYTSQRFET